MRFEYLLLGTATLLLVSILASKASGRVGIPALLLFLIVGMLAGSDGIGGIAFNDAALAQSLGTVALIFILFSGGMDTVWGQVRMSLGPGLMLATFGVLMTAFLMALFIMYMLGYSWQEGLLLGAIVSSTDAAAVFAVLRSSGVGLRGNLKPLIELESGSNDPMAIFLTTALVGLILQPEMSLFSLVPMFFLQMVVGAALGYWLGKGMVFVINRLRLEYEGLYPVLSIALVLFTFSLTASLGGNGFLAVYLAGLVVGNRDVIHRRSLMRFHDGMAWLMQIAMFITLGLLVFPSQLPGIAGIGLLMSAFLIFIARPVSVVLALLPFGMSIRKITMVGWVGLRGAVPIILATFPLLAGIGRANEMFNIVFFIVLTSILVQGSTIPVVARWLRVAAPMQKRLRSPLEFESTDGIQGALTELEIHEGSPAQNKRIVELGLPKGALLILVGRNERFFVPNGGTELFANDTLFFLSEPESLKIVEKILGRPD